ncbi:hypothetical protein Patl1_04562 [Pistacia atlantica]|uniref:Uncharacterized protein n=1 Tax=Pistacia atlantica TaxID=434234 RepID=A0ACC1BW77_9ROSI|nr:hypothetical protein Patl1_04562 [Pistacia atlantica]
MNGVMSVRIEGEDRDRLTVIGDGYDPVKLIHQMRKKFGQAEILAAVRENDVVRITI